MSILIRFACLAAALAVLALTGGSPQAYAGDYRVHTCKLPDGSPAATDGWAPGAHAPGFTQINECGLGGGLHTQMEGAGVSVGVERAWRWTPAPSTTLQQVDLYRAFSLTSGDSSGTPMFQATAGSVSVEREGSSSESGTGVSSRGSFDTWNLPSNHLTAFNPTSTGASSIGLALGCQGQPFGTCPATGAVSDLRIDAATFTLRDTLAPSITNVGGSLVSPGDKKGIEALQFDATDAGA